MSEIFSAGTTYDGATALLQAATPVTPGAHTLYLSIFDQGDHILDSAAFIDNVGFYQVADPATECVPGTQSDARPPLIFIPGFAGSKLAGGSGELWPNTLEMILPWWLYAPWRGPTHDIFLHDLDMDEYGNSLDGAIHASGLLEDVLGVHFYDEAIDYLTNAAGRADPYRRTGDDQDLFVFAYDWRKSLRSERRSDGWPEVVVNDQDQTLLDYRLCARHNGRRTS